nr:type I polyketide synthase [Goodfellowiella coeruleoviolacea]
MNQDGASNGLTAPSGRAQERVIAAALADAGLAPSDVDVVEAHGTGTPLGDPIEAQALIAAYGVNRSERGPLWLGSVKSNIGHTQAAAGVAGVIKMLMAMRHGILPRTLHVDEPSPHVDWSRGVRLLREQQPWPAGGSPRRAGVSSFGISGTNAHVILEQAPPPQPPPDTAEPGGAQAWVLSARTPTALAATAHALATAVGPQRTPTHHVTAALATGRAALEQRAVVIAEDRDGLITGLTALARGQSSPDVVRTAPAAGRTALLFSGQGSQRPGAGRELYQSAPVFARAWDEVCARLDPHLPVPLSAVAFADPGSAAAARLGQTVFAQAAVFALQVSLHQLLRSAGITTSFLLGHSVGEVTAAHLSGALSLADACRLVRARGEAMAAAPATGGMAVIEASEQEVTDALASCGAPVVVAAVNSPTSTVVSGDRAAVRDCVRAWRERGRRTRLLDVDRAFHSPQLDAVLPELARDLAPLSGGALATPVVSTATGDVVSAELLRSPEHWVRHARQPVRYRDAVLALHRRGVTTFLELGPDAVLTAPTEQCLAPAEHAVLPALRTGRSERRTLLAAVAALWTRGTQVDWAGLHHALGHPPGRPGRTGLPTYPFEHQRYWRAAAPNQGPAVTGARAIEHAVLTAVVSTADGRGAVLTGLWRPERDEVPTATDLLDLVLCAAAQVGAAAVAELTVHAAPRPAGRAPLQVQVVVERRTETRPAVSVHTRPHPAVDDADWTVVANGWLTRDAAPAHPRDDTERGQHTDRVEVVLPESADHATALPLLLDEALRALAPGLVPAVFRDVRQHAAQAETLRVSATRTAADALRLTADDLTGSPVLTVGTIGLRPAEPGKHVVAAPDLYEPRWEPLGGGESHQPAVDTAVDTDVVLLPVRGDGDVVRSAHASASEVLGRLHAWLADAHRSSSVLVVVTSGAVQTGADDPVRDPAAATAWGLVRSAATEYPGRFLLADIERWAELDGLVPLLAERGLLTGAHGNQFAVRAGQVHTPRLVRATVHTADPDADAPMTAGTVLITGGTGALGAEVARHLARRPDVSGLVLVSRSGMAAPGADQLCRELAESGVAVDVAAADVSDRNALARIVARIGPDLVGVVHTAGVVDDGVLTGLTPHRLDRVLSAKLDPAWWLHELTREHDLRMFVLFSSASGVLGAPGQANYAAANAFLDALASVRGASGLAGVSVAWGPWSLPGGMAAHLDQAQWARIERGGVRPMSTSRALELFDLACAAGRAQLVPVDLDRDALRRQPPEHLPTVLRALVPAAPPLSARASAAAPTRLVSELAGLPVTSQRRLVLDLVRREAAVVLGHRSARDVDPDRALPELGFDSLNGLELRNRLAAATGVGLPASAVFDHPTATELAEHLLAELTAGSPEAAPNPVTALLRMARDSDRVEVGLDLLGVVAQLRVGTDQPADLAGGCRLVPLSGAEDGHPVLCFPPVTTPSGALAYARFARGLDDEWRTATFTLPGHRTGEPLPASLTALAEALVLVVRDQPEPPVLLGHSSGGWLAHEVATALARRGTPAAAVVLVDSLWPNGAAMTRMRSRIFAELLRRPDLVDALDDVRLTATGAYGRLFADWTPTDPACPVLLVRASRPLGPDDGTPWRATWYGPHAAVDTPGDHLEVMESRSGDTARAVGRWLSATLGPRGPRRGRFAQQGAR